MAVNKPVNTHGPKTKTEAAMAGKRASATSSIIRSVFNPPSNSTGAFAIFAVLSVVSKYFFSALSGHYVVSNGHQIDWSDLSCGPQFANFPLPFE